METYVIRMATRREDDVATADADLRGVVEHVGSGRRESFSDARKLLAFLQAEDRRKHEEVDEQ